MGSSDYLFLAYRRQDKRACPVSCPRAAPCLVGGTLKKYATFRIENAAGRKARQKLPRTVRFKARNAAVACVGGTYPQSKTQTQYNVLCNHRKIISVCRRCLSTKHTRLPLQSPVGFKGPDCRGGLAPISTPSQLVWLESDNVATFQRQCRIEPWWPNGWEVAS